MRRHLTAAAGYAAGYGAVVLLERALLRLEQQRRPAPFVLFEEQPESLEEAVQLALGAASVCWEDLDGAGVFLSDRVLEVSDQLCAYLRANA